MEWERHITLLSFAREEETSFGKYFVAILNRRIEDHASQSFCEIALLDIGVHIIIPGREFVLEHPISFEGNEIHVK
jgi:hypothetical protein